MREVTKHWDGRRVLVTGGSGFLGRFVVEQLKNDGAVVSAPRSADYDLTDAAATDAALSETQPETIVHLAARVGGIGANLAAPGDLYVANLLMGTNVIEAARRHDVGHTVVVGTICSYPKLTPVPFREDALWDGYPEESNAPYGLAKKANLVHAQANHAQFGQPVSYVMPTNLYGPGDKFHEDVSHVIPALMRKCVEAAESKGRAIEVWGTGSATREFLYVADAARGVLLAGECIAEPVPINLGSGREMSIREIAERVAAICGFTGKLRWDPTKPDGQPRRRLDTSRAEELLGFRASTNLDDGLAETYDWYMANRVEANNRL